MPNDIIKLLRLLADFEHFCNHNDYLGREVTNVSTDELSEDDLDRLYAAKAETTYIDNLKNNIHFKGSSDSTHKLK